MTCASKKGFDKTKCRALGIPHPDDLIQKDRKMDSSDKCMAMCIWAIAAVLMVGTICLTVYHLKFVDSGLVQQIQDVSIPVKVWVKQ